MTVAEMHPVRTVEWSVAARPFPGEAESGDRAVVVSSPAGMLLAVADGLGHGSSATLAAELAADVLREAPSEGLSTLVARCHERLRETRGVAISIARLQDAELRWLGVGNVEGRLVRRSVGRGAVATLLLMPGLVGHALPPLEAQTVPLAFGDTLILATDGIAPSFDDVIDLSGTAEDVAHRILSAHARPTDDALVLVARYIGGSR